MNETRRRVYVVVKGCSLIDNTTEAVDVTETTTETIDYDGSIRLDYTENVGAMICVHFLVIVIMPTLLLMF